MKLWDNDLRNMYKQQDINAYYWCVDFCWKAIENAVDTVKDVANNAGAVAGAVAGKITQPIAQGIEDAGNTFGNAMQTVGDATGVSGLVNTIGEKTGLKELGQNIHAGFQYGAGLIPEQHLFDINHSINQQLGYLHQPSFQNGMHLFLLLLRYLQLLFQPPLLLPRPLLQLHLFEL